MHSERRTANAVHNEPSSSECSTAIVDDTLSDESLVPKTCSRTEVCVICAFFLLLTVLAIYVTLAYPQALALN
jgi:hypothetical protein